MPNKKLNLKATTGNTEKIPIYFKGTPFKLRSQSPAKTLGDDKDMGYQGAGLVNVTKSSDGKNILGDDDNTNATLTNTAATNLKSSDYNIDVKTQLSSSEQWLLDNPGGGNVSAADIRRRAKAIIVQDRKNKKLKNKKLQTINMIPPSK